MRYWRNLCSKCFLSRSDTLEVKIQEKIVTDKHLGADWKERYPYLANGLKSEKDALTSLSEIESEIILLKTKPQETTSTVDLESQKLILTLCQGKEIIISPEDERYAAKFISHLVSQP